MTKSMLTHCFPNEYASTSCVSLYDSSCPCSPYVPSSDSGVGGPKSGFATMNPRRPPRFASSALRRTGSVGRGPPAPAGAPAPRVARVPRRSVLRTLAPVPLLRLLLPVPATACFYALLAPSLHACVAPPAVLHPRLVVVVLRHVRGRGRGDPWEARGEACDGKDVQDGRVRARGAHAVCVHAGRPGL
ncbi:uncharacterized protein C8Q71DRAFT_524317 [Rhodofomes roseus]|uniref:Uncharacterized protein n=1 Tax=Rhodofomes roseus TaxID=34475 RepID=A0ABQ8KJM0_9APHY|nr:uncharacterized protein C8Q71DRAFT_524317 [Rhodofomes roseus]KAH9838339.1 hypothetical protein C8Q71DRAFT_524317 [Rhodofomes roseus]